SAFAFSIPVSNKVNFIALLNQQTVEKQLLKEKVVLVSVFVKKLCKIVRLAFLQAHGVPA
ncbi:hypothetical protein ACYBDK_09280, partial [Klebsiella pneumoniae]